MNDVSVSKGVLVSGGLAYSLVELAKQDPVHQMWYGIMIASICIIYRVTDIIKHWKDKND